MTSTQFMDAGSAPWVVIPETEIVSVEHPCVVKNTTKAIDMLGGPQALAQNLEQGTQQTLSLSFNPSDPASRTILSLHNDTSNVLLKVTVPKRTGRKRKRGTNDPYVEDASVATLKADATHLVDSMRDNPDGCTVEAVGGIKSCHVWRAIPDFVYFTKASKFMNNVESRILPQQYPLLKEWSIPRTYGLEDTEIIPLPVLSVHSLPHNYTYRQNPAVKTFADPTTGTKVLQNKAAPLRLHIQIKLFDDPSYPTVPSPGCPPLENQSPQIKELVKQLQTLFDVRPIWTRRALINSLPADAMTPSVRIAAAYVCYSLRSGPWRDAYCKFGVDPRTDPKYRKYQTILLQLTPKDKLSMQTRGPIQKLWTRSPDIESHIFKGDKAVAIDGKTWQLCDLQDPVLKDLVDIPDLHIRAECEIRYFGWYQNGTSAKMRVLLKAKVDALAKGEDLDSDMMNTFLKLPDDWVPKAKASGPSGPTTGYLPEGSSSKELEWAAAYRSISRTISGTLPNYGGSGKGRLNKPKPTARPSYIASDQGLEPNEANAEGALQEAESDAEAALQYEEPEEGDDDLAADEDIEGEAAVG